MGKKIGKYILPIRIIENVACKAASVLWALEMGGRGRALACVYIEVVHFSIECALSECLSKKHFSKTEDLLMFFSVTT